MENQTVIKVSNFKDIPEPSGLRDDGHIFLTCSACGRKLVDVWVVKKDAIDPRTRKPFEWNLQAKCCFCGDKSFPTVVHGRFFLGAFGRDVPSESKDEMWDSILETVVSNIETKGNTIIYHTKKAN